MGNENLTKDPNIEIYLQLKSLLLVTGEKARGCIYVHVKQYSTYSDLMLRLQCFEKTESAKIKNKHKQPLFQQKRTYIEDLKISQFLNGLYQGYHQFPFNFILPQELPGSLILNKSNYIRYRLTAYLQSSEPSLSNQIHSRQLWVLQKFRGLTQPIFSRKNHSPNCCMWGYSYGNLQTQIQCQSNNLKAGQKVKIRFKINTNRMNSSIKLAKIKLVEKNIIIVQGNVQLKQTWELFSFDFNQNSIQKGEIKQIEKKIQLPVDLYPTAIGQNIARFYVIRLQLYLSCFSHTQQQIHIFINSNKNDITEENKFFNRPKKWKPLKYKKEEFRQLKKYIYNPNKQIYIHNRFKSQNLKLDAMKYENPSPMSSRKLI